MKENIENIKYSLYKKAEQLWWLSLLGWALAVIFSIFAIYINDKDKLQIIGIVSAILPFGIIWLRELSAGYSYKADKGRRLILYSDGLGVNPSDSELLSIESYMLGDNVAEAFYEPPYYESELPGGPERLLDIAGESAFFTKELSGKTAKVLNVILAVCLTVLLILGISSKFWLGFSGLSDKSLGDFIEAFSLFVLSLVAGDIFLLRVKYANLAEESNKIFESIFNLKKSAGLVAHDVMRLISDYDACVQACPPIPTILYKKYLKELNKVYKGVVNNGLNK